MRVFKEAFVADLRLETGLERGVLKKALNATLELISGRLENGDEVQFSGFGTFKTKTRGPTRVPASFGEWREVPAKKVAVFSPGNELKNRVAKRDVGAVS